MVISNELNTHVPASCESYLTGYANIVHQCVKVETEVCASKIFKATCADNEIIYMEEAFYGRMHKGKCIDTDHYIGCKNDALETFEKLISGKGNCEIVISNELNTHVTGSCESYLTGYANIVHKCIQVAAVATEMCYESGMTLASSKTLIASEILREKCRNGKLKLMVSAGQRMNVNITAFSGENNLPLGVIREKGYGNAAYPRTGVKHQQVITSVGNELELDFQNAASKVTFLYEVTVLGCGDMSPPQGAWITRNDDVIYIGCHSGSKSWSLQCVDNQWVGVMGHCGIGHEAKKTDVSIVVEEESSDVSLDVLVFGVFSLVILASACVFLIGTIILKRKLRPSKLSADNPMTMSIYGYPDSTRRDTATSRLIYTDKSKD